MANRVKGECGGKYKDIKQIKMPNLSKFETGSDKTTGTKKGTKK